MEFPDRTLAHNTNPTSPVLSQTAAPQVAEQGVYSATTNPFYQLLTHEQEITAYYG